MSRLTRDGTAETVSQNQILRRERRQGNIHFPCCSANHVQDWQPYPADPYSCYMCEQSNDRGGEGMVEIYPPLHGGCNQKGPFGGWEKISL